MKTLILTLLLTAVPALAAPPPQPAPPVPFTIESEPRAPHTTVYPGVVHIESHAARINIAYLPVLEPLPGSVPSTTSVIPTAFALNHTSFPEKKPRPRSARLNPQWLTAGPSRY